MLLPLMILTGLTMSPAIDAAWPWLVDLFGGRQTARSIHFIVAWLIVAFVLVHLVMVVLAGPINEVRSMITGRYRLPREKRLMARLLTRRRLLLDRRGRGAGARCSAAATGSGASPSFRDMVLGTGEWLSYRVHRLIGSDGAGARVRPLRDVAGVPHQRQHPAALGASTWRTPPTGFADWRLGVDGLVERPQAFSLAELRAMPARTQITRHDCVEGWSAIGKWTGVPLGARCSKQVRLQPQRALRRLPLRRRFRGTAYYESIDLDRRLPPADDPRLRHERRGAADRARRAAAAAGRAPARLQAREVRDARSRRSAAFANIGGGKRRLLGGRRRLRLVRGI